ncbi:MAG: aldehyde dehydrogenase (NADP(+)) [Parvularcula sp.]|jgi:NADP-dependent aldehyde dehydrogenase|nr:aldehyde dehydrogenase (NADP(+)) [Parvularcula sp.]
MALTGNHFIAGEVRGAVSPRFDSNPFDGPSLSVAEGGPDEVDQAMRAAEEAFAVFSEVDGAGREALLREIAGQIEACGDEIAKYGQAETGLPEARLRGETGRTTGQLRMFADFVEAGKEAEPREDVALPDRAPLPRPHLKLHMRPVGPVVVFGASNFPLAFSVAGGDTASALAAGCPVVVKGHPAHPATGEIVAKAITDAVSACGLPAGVFSLIQGATHELGHALVTHPLTAAVGFTGSLRAGRALFDLCAARPTPIPFFGELGSINPVFVLPHALAARGTDIATGWVASLTMGAGQFCTNPGLLVLPAGEHGDAFVETARKTLAKTASQKMLTEGIAHAYMDGCGAIAACENVTSFLSPDAGARAAAPALMQTDAATFLDNSSLGHEVFGPFGLVVRTDSAAQRSELAHSLDGQLTFTLQIDPEDRDEARALLPIAQRKAGRVLANGFPTGVEVADAMVHGGPYPASTNFGHSSVGTIAIRRWLRPVCEQDLPEWLANS